MPHYNLPHNHGQNIEKVLNKMPSAEGFKDISFLFQQLGDPTRLRILWLLCHCEGAYLTLGIALRVEDVGLALAEGAVVLSLETYERGEGAMRAVVPYLAHVVSDTLCHDARRTDGGGRHGDA